MLSATRGCAADPLNRLVDALLVPMDEALGQLRETLKGLPDEEGCALVVRDLYEQMFKRIIEGDGIPMVIRPGFSRVIACSYPSGLENSERVASGKGEFCWRASLGATRCPVAFVRAEGGRMRAFLGVVHDDRPFGGLFLERFRAVLDRVHDEIFAMTVRDAFDSLLRNAARYQTVAASLSQAFGLKSDVCEIPAVAEILYQGGVRGEA